MVHAPLLRVALLASCSGLALALAAPAARAVEVKATWSYTVGPPPGSTNSNSVSHPISVDESPFDSDSFFNGVFGHHYANDGGSFGTRSSGDGNFEKQGTAQWSDTFTNTGTTPISLTASFVIDSGSLDVVMPAAIGAYRASITAQIDVDGSAVFTTSAQLDMADGGTPTFTGDTLLNPSGPSLPAGNGSYSWGSYLGTVDLGTLAPGEDVTVKYLLSSYTSGILQDCSYGGYGGYGGNGDALQGANNGVGPNCTDGYAVARIGDPIDFQGSQFSVTSAPVTTPEPAGMAVLGAGLAALAFRKRRPAV